MKLFYSINSPFARKCRVVMIEKKLENKIDLVAVNSLESPPELIAINPLCTVPALITDDGLHLCESPIICEYLDSFSAPHLIPKDDSRICVMAMAALADGIMDAAVACVIEGRRPKELQYAMWRERKENAVMRGIAKFAAVPLKTDEFNMGTLGLAIALAYVNFRLPHIAWAGAHPKLAAWFGEFYNRLSLQETKPAAQ